MPHTATLAFTVERASISAPALEFFMFFTPVPTDLLTALGVYVSNDTFATVVVGSRPAVKRTITLQLSATTPATFNVVQDSENHVLSVSVAGAGSGYGGQPIIDMSQFLAKVAPGGTLPPNRNGKGVPQLQILMKVEAGIIGGGGGAGYTTPATVHFEGNTVAGGHPATGHTTTDGSSINGFVVDDPGSGYCMAPRVVLTGGGGEGAQVMVSMNVDHVNVTAPGNSVLDVALFPASPTSEAFDLVAGPDPFSRAQILASMMQAALQTATGFPVISAAPVIT